MIVSTCKPHNQDTFFLHHTAPILVNLLLVGKLTNLIYFVCQVTFQYALWDRFKVLNSLSQVNRMNLCRLCTHLISSKALSLAVLRVSLC